MATSNSSRFTSFRQSLPSSRFSFRIYTSSSSANDADYIDCNPLLGHLESDLTRQIYLLRLEQGKDQQDVESGYNYLSAKWLARAMDVVLSAHSSVKEFIPDLQQQGLSEQQGTLCKLLEESLEDNIRLLDACQTLLNRLSSMANLHSLAKLIARLLMGSSYNRVLLKRAKHAISIYRGKLTHGNDNVGRTKLVSCASMLRRMGERLNSADAVDGYVKSNFSTMGAMYAAHFTAILICGFLIYALSTGRHGHHRRALSTGHHGHHHHQKPSKQLFSVPITPHTPWLLGLSTLQHRVKEETEKHRTKSSAPILEELENVDSLLESLECSIDKAISSDLNKSSSTCNHDYSYINPSIAANLERFAHELSDGLARTEQQVSKLYNVLITIRMMLLDVYPKLCPIHTDIFSSSHLTK